MALRDVFYTGAKMATFNGPTGITYHPCGEAGFVVQNFNDYAVSVTISGTSGIRLIDRFSGKPLSTPLLTLPARGRVWVQPVSLR